MMRGSHASRLPATAMLAAALVAMSFALSPAGAVAKTQASVSVFATGFNNPRGLTFGPDGDLYVAEGGKGGTRSTVGQCKQAPDPVGPYTGGFTGRISVVDPFGNRTTRARRLPSSETGPALGSLISGVADVAFVGSTLYALTSGAGCSHGLAGTDNKMLRVASDGSWSGVANLSAFIKTHPVANPEKDDFEPDGTWYSMTSVNGTLYAVEPNHGMVVGVNPKVSVTQLVDVSATFGHVVPTAIAFSKGNFYLGNLGTFPFSGSNIYEVAPSGRISVFASGLTAVLGVAFDAQGRLYALENTTGNPEPTPNTGAIVRWNGSGWDTIVSGLNLPTGMAFGPDGNLYVSACGFGCPSGAGEIDRVDLS